MLSARAATSTLISARVFDHHMGMCKGKYQSLESWPAFVLICLFININHSVQL
jgi:hypothetical protein